MTERRDDPKALPLVFAFGPVLEPEPRGSCGVPVGVNLTRPPSRLHQQWERPHTLAGGEPVVGCQPRLGATGLERGCQLAVQRAASRPVRSRVERLTDEVVPEGRDSRLDLAEQTAVQHLAEAVVVAELGEQLELDVDAHHSGRLERGPAVLGEALRPDAKRIAERLGDGHARSFLQLQAVRPRFEPAGDAESSVSSSTKNGTPCVRS